MKKLAILGMSAAMLLSGCGNGNQNTPNTARNTTNANMNTNSNSTVSTNMNPNGVNSNSAVVQDNFWTTAAQGGMAEVELGKLAASKATNAEVKKFAQMMVTDHTKANTELKDLAAKNNIVLPTEVNSSQKSLMDDLNKATGADFDKTYVDAMVDDHEEDVEMFEDKAKNSTDPNVKAFAAKTLPTLKKHLETIKAIQAKMK
ncbi:MAG TPA: DUF4142 domain-containing protein [Pyrinomonadaceae bacterium]|nr:DUF4142 domain-containing protein [Pyrinomonadaceae bacterium]